MDFRSCGIGTDGCARRVDFMGFRAYGSAVLSVSGGFLLVGGAILFVGGAVCVGLLIKVLIKGVMRMTLDAEGFEFHDMRGIMRWRWQDADEFTTAILVITPIVAFKMALGRLGQVILFSRGATVGYSIHTA
jgi:hypothetical protein